ncbi:MAG: dihydroorotase, partial [Fluviibacter sp.]
VRSAGGNVGATITAHHLLYNRNAIFQGVVRPHYYCLPVLKRETHREALVEAAPSGSPQFFLGTDSAPHAKLTKEAACGCAGCYTAGEAMEMYATAFDAVGALDKLEGFASLHGPAFYGLPVNERKVVLRRAPMTVSTGYPYINGDTLVPLEAGNVLPWTFAGAV